MPVFGIFQCYYSTCSFVADNAPKNNMAKRPFMW